VVVSVMGGEREWRVLWTSGRSKVAKTCADENEARSLAANPYRPVEGWRVRVQSREMGRWHRV
jgi:hypothetical protein